MRVSESFFVALEFNSVSENDSRTAVNRHITGSLQVEGQLEKTVLHSQLPRHSTGIDPKGNWGWRWPLRHDLPVQRNHLIIARHYDNGLIGAGSNRMPVPGRLPRG